MPPSVEDIREQSLENNAEAVLAQMREALKPVADARYQKLSEDLEESCKQEELRKALKRVKPV